MGDACHRGRVRYRTIEDASIVREQENPTSMRTDKLGRLGYMRCHENEMHVR
jgi:hypothetical protein